MHYQLDKRLNQFYTFELRSFSLHIVVCFFFHIIKSSPSFMIVVYSLLCGHGIIYTISTMLTFLGCFQAFAIINKFMLNLVTAISVNTAFCLLLGLPN